MRDTNDWGSALEAEIVNAEAIDKRLIDTNLDEETKEVIKQRLLSTLKQDMLFEY
jgi:hypothetical protein